MNEKQTVNPWLIAISVMLATFMEVLDTSIANVALQYIAGSLSVSTDESTWVLTTYLISNAIVMPTTAWFGRRFGRKRFLMFCVAVFTGASLFCGLSTSLPMLLLMRAIQGAGGGALQPTAQAILLENFPKEKHGVAMAVYGIGVVIAPILGPVLGGWITDSYSWRWIFFINVPVGLLALVLMHLFISDPHWIRDAKPPRLDVIGFGFMSLWLGCQEVVMDKGQEDDWFGSHFIVLMASLAAVGFVVFLIRVLSAAKPFVDLSVLKNYNFSLGTTLMFFQGVTLYGLTVALPLFMQTLLGYTALTSGVAMIPRGLGALVGMPIAGKLVNKLPGRYLVAGGFLSFAASSFLLARIDLDISPHVLVWPLFVSGVSIAFLFVPLNTLALGALRPEQMGNASGIFNLMRNVGGSIGISVVTTLVDRRGQVHQTFLAGHLTPYDKAYQAKLLGMSSMLAHQSGTFGGHQQALGEMGKILTGQASLLAYIDNFLFFAGLCGLCAAAALFMKNIRAASPIMAH
jgi:MFS transporter, DHA2 family, multidrug resistance protein